MKLQAELRQEYADLGKPAEFSIDFEYRLVLTKKPSAADILLTSGPGGEPVQVVEVAKDPSITHPLRQKEAIEELRKILDSSAVNQYDFQCALKAHNLRKRPDFHYKGTVPGNQSQYSHALVQWLRDQYAKDNQFFIKARAAVVQ